MYLVLAILKGQVIYRSGKANCSTYCPDLCQNGKLSIPREADPCAPQEKGV